MDQEDLEDLKRLYPDLSPEDLVVAKANLDQYLALAWEIFEDAGMAAAPKTADDFAERPSSGSIQGKVDSQQT
jgi:hypothetical protein